MEFIKATEAELKDLLEAWAIKVSPTDIMQTAREWGLVEEGAFSRYGEFAKIYLAYRRSMKHRGVSLIKPGSRLWKVLVEVADEAMAFSSENEMQYREGFRVFLEVAGQITNSMRLLEIRSKADKIHEYYIALHIIRGDTNARLTNQLLQEYEANYLRTQGDLPFPASNPLEAQYFVEAAVLCKEFKFRPRDYMVMMFDEFAWLGAPKPYHMVGPKAKELLERGHTAKHGKTKVKRISLKHITKENRHGE